jgi:hypothetical protein
MMSEGQLAVQELIAERVPLDQIEDYIDTLPLDADHRSALWLLAWVQATNSSAREQIIGETSGRRH